MAEQLAVLGSRRLRDGLRTGEVAVNVFRDLLKDFGTDGFSCFTGAMSEGLRLIDTAQTKGWRFNREGTPIGSPSDIAVQVNRAVAQRDIMLLCEYVRLVSGALDAMRGQIDWSLSANADKPDQRPIPIAIVAMPTRESSLELTRDEDQEITSTRTIERDIPLEPTAPTC